MPVATPRFRLFRHVCSLSAIAGVTLACPAGAQAPRVFTFDVPASELPAFSAAIRNGVPVGDLRFDPATRWSTGEVTAPVFRGQFNCHSAPYCTSPNNTTGAFSFLTPQVFFGAWLSGPSDNIVFGGLSQPNRAFWQLFLGNTVVYESSILTLSPTSTFLAASYTGLIDRVVLRSPDPDANVGNIAVDDITYGAMSTVPEPSTLALMGGGLLTLACFTMRRRYCAPA